MLAAASLVASGGMDWKLSEVAVLQLQDLSSSIVWGYYCMGSGCVFVSGRGAGGKWEGRLCCHSGICGGVWGMCVAGGLYGECVLLGVIESLQCRRRPFGSSSLHQPHPTQAVSL